MCFGLTQVANIYIHVILLFYKRTKISCANIKSVPMICPPNGLSSKGHSQDSKVSAI